MIRLGSFDVGVMQDTLRSYAKQVETITRVPVDAVADGSDRLRFGKYRPDNRQPMTVSNVQQALKDSGFFPGGQVDGICGYRTLSAIRLFQEYVRTVENKPVVPDGLFGPTTQGHLRRWIDGAKQPEWQQTIDRWKNGTTGGSEYARWLSLLSRVRDKYTATPNRMLQMVNAFSADSDTRRVAEWAFDPMSIHLIGIRRSEITGKFDDVIILLLKGMVFTFQGSTEPGATTNSKGLPFLVQGQHDYHFGWHRKQYLALRPRRLNRGVLVVRSKNNRRLDNRDLDGGLERNASINIHWGGKGISFDVNTWSAGCQVINGTMYLNHKNDMVSCADFVARNNGEVARNSAKTRGAYNVLVDLVTALSSDMGSSTVKYMLLTDADLDLDPALKAALADARARAGALIR